MSNNETMTVSELIDKLNCINELITQWNSHVERLVPCKEANEYHKLITEVQEAGFEFFSHYESEEETTEGLLHTTGRGDFWTIAPKRGQ